MRLAVASCAAAVMVLAGCTSGGRTGGKGDRVESPAALRSATVAMLREVIAVTGMEVTGALYGATSCNDQGDPPFRGSGSLRVKRPGTLPEIRAQLSGWVSKLEAAGWSTHVAGISHDTVSLAKNGWVLDLDALPPTDSLDPIGFHGQKCTELTGISTENEAPGEDITSLLR